jgi:hypothetical protein
MKFIAPELFRSFTPETRGRAGARNFTQSSRGTQTSYSYSYSYSIRDPAPVESGLATEQFEHEYEYEYEYEQEHEVAFFFLCVVGERSRSHCPALCLDTRAVFRLGCVRTQCRLGRAATAHQQGEAANR